MTRLRKDTDYTAAYERAETLLDKVTAIGKLIVADDTLTVTRLGAEFWAHCDYTLAKRVSVVTVTAWFMDAGAQGVMHSTRWNVNTHAYVTEISWRVGE
jgi:hypothetical protein